MARPMGNGKNDTEAKILYDNRTWKHCHKTKNVSWNKSYMQFHFYDLFYSFVINVRSVSLEIPFKLKKIGQY